MGLHIMDTETIAKALGNAKKVNGSWVASCPVPGHGRGNGDKNPSLSISESEGKVLFHCHGGCDQRDVFDSVRERNLLPTTPKREEISFTQHQAPVLQQEWVYTAEDGSMLAFRSPICCKIIIRPSGRLMEAH